MKHNSEYTSTVIETINKQVKVHSLSLLMVSAVMLLLVSRFLYTALNYIPISSVIVILSISGLMALTGVLMVQRVSHEAINTISDYSRQLNGILSGIREMHGLTYVDEIIDKALANLETLVDIDCCAVYEEEGGSLVCRYARGKWRDKRLGKSYRIASSPAGRAFLGEPAVTGAPDECKGEHAERLYHAPLKLELGSIGVLEVVTEKDHSLTADEESLIGYYADQLAVAITRARFQEDQKNYEMHFTEFLLTTMDNLIPEKRGHARRVAHYALLTANNLGMSDQAKNRLYKASLLHDIGFLKMKADDLVSYEDFKKHAQIAYEMLRQVNFYTEIAPVILHHHERYDGLGYPAGIKGDDIPLESRIIAIAETFDAMTWTDSYKNAGRMVNDDVLPFVMDLTSTLEEIKLNSGAQFDPVVVDAFTAAMAELNVSMQGAV